MIKGKVGLGIVTCNRSKYLEKCLESVKNCIIKHNNIDYTVLVNDGESDLSKELYNDIDGCGYIKDYIHNSKNLGVGKSKNILLRKMLDAGCEHIFIIEDDCIITDGNVFKKYIDTANRSGILHLCYGPGSPLNLKQDNNVDIYNRDKLSTILEPNPKLIIDYGNDIGVALYQHCVGMFCYFHRSVLEKVGLFDETYYNAWEHCDHTLEIINAGYHPPFWWFADIKDSDKYLAPADEDHIKNSIIAKDSPKWKQNVEDGMKHFTKKHGKNIGQIPVAPQEYVVNWLRNRKKQIS
jgi:GT2 family glycosyltransferase